MTAPPDNSHGPPPTLGYTIAYVDDVRSTLEFYVAAFGLEQRFVTPEGDYGELDTGPTALAFASNDLAEANLSGTGGFTRLDAATPPPAVSITLVTDDVAGTVDAATVAGALPYVEPTVKPWGQVVAYVVDPNGMLVEIATPVSP
jgi:catechol 2,3-dioxygenase-like lactoylglutathione lyase family enzyme